MSVTYKFNKGYFLITLLLFVVESVIALFVFDSLVRPFIGDLLVVILIYCFVRSFVNAPVLSIAASVLIFSYFIEFLQYLDVITLLGLQNNRAAILLIGTSFSWMDMLMYTAGILMVLLLEKLKT